MKVLIADDDRALVHMLGAAFVKRGWQVTRAFDAMQALMYTKQSPRPDAVVLDLGMPGGSGLDVLDKLSRSAITFGIPVIVVTGNEDEAVAEKARELGAFGFLKKPVDPEALIDEVERVAGAPPG